MLRFVLTPIITMKVIRANDRTCKYISGLKKDNGRPVDWAMCTYGASDVGMVACDVSSVQAAFLTAQPDTAVFPADLATLIGSGAAIAVQTKLESFNIPSDWIIVGMTYAQVVKHITSMFMLAERLEEHGHKVDPIDSKIKDIPNGKRDLLEHELKKWGAKTDKFSSATPLRSFLKEAIPIWAGEKLYLGGLDVESGVRG